MGQSLRLHARLHLINKVFRYFHTFSVKAAVQYSFTVLLHTTILCLYHRADVSYSYSSFNLSITYVSIKQSLTPITYSILPYGLLLPKLRSHSVEFLKQTSLKSSYSYTYTPVSVLLRSLTSSAFLGAHYYALTTTYLHTYLTDSYLGTDSTLFCYTCYIRTLVFLII